MEFETVDDYLAAISEPARTSLDRLRAICRSELPAATECISYGIPTYKYHGFVASFAAFKNHCSFFPGHTVADFASELAGYKLSKGTIQFDPLDPIPEDLVRRILQARAEENVASATAKA